MYPRYVSPLSSMVWNAASVGANEQSPGVRIFNCSWGSAFGHTSASTTITVMESQDGVNWYASQNSQTSSGDFAIDFQTGAEFVALKSSGAATITAVVSAK